MCNKKLILWAVCSSLAIILGSCTEDSDSRNPSWGKTDCYEQFLWKKYVPDTLSRVIRFDFNEDARNYMREPLQLALFKKTDGGKMLPLTEFEAEVFADGVKCADNIVRVTPDMESIVLGIVFNPQAESKVHHYYFRVINDGGLDRINDMDSGGYNADNTSLMEVEAEKRDILNPLAQASIAFAIIVIAALLVWLIVLKPIFFPVFKVSRVQLVDPVPYSSMKRIRGYRLLVLTNKQPSQGIVSQIFTGKILYEVNALWEDNVFVEPRDRKSVRLRCPKAYSATARILKANQEYTITNNNSGTKTKIKIF